jgi:Leucine-rich repeat (LRR) protein
MYEITFVNDENLSTDDSRVLRAGLFKTYNIKRLFMSNIGLEKIEDGAFDGAGLSNYLEELDLRSNTLKKLEKDTLKGLVTLKILRLGNNSLQFEDSNFIYNEHLTDIDLSSNNLQYLPKKLLDGLKSLKKVDLSNNYLRTISACHFYSQSAEKQTSLLKFYQVNVDLSGNEINCSCELFFLDRKTNIKLKVLCNKPGYYKNKSFHDLINENPNCDYGSIRNQCESVYQDHLYLVENNNAYRIATLILAILLIIVNLALICSCCRLCSLNDKIDLLTRHYNKKQTKKHNDKKYEYLTNMQ